MYVKADYVEKPVVTVCRTCRNYDAKEQYCHQLEKYMRPRTRGECELWEKVRIRAPKNMGGSKKDDSDMSKMQDG